MADTGSVGPAGETKGSSNSHGQPLISVVIPVYNEDEQAALEVCLREVRTTLESYGRPWEIVFVDDCSRDGSLVRLLSFLEDERITVVEHTRNLGAVKAILSGMRVSRGDVVIPFDPDLQYPAACLPLLAEQVLKGYDFAGGIRVGRKHPFLKRLSSGLGSRIINRVMKIRQVDFGSIKAYNRKMVNGILSLPPDYMAIQAAAFSLSRNFVEIPIPHLPRTVGESKFTFLMRLDLFLDIYASYSRHPLSLMMLSGVCMVLAGLVLGAGIGAWYLVAGRPVSTTAVMAMVADAFLAFMGLNFMCLSLLGQFAVRTFRRSSVESDREAVKVHRGRLS